MRFSPAVLDALTLRAAPKLMRASDRALSDVARDSLALAMAFFGSCRATVVRVERTERGLLGRGIWSAATDGEAHYEGAEIYEEAFPVSLPRIAEGHYAWWGCDSYHEFVELLALGAAEIPGGGGYIAVPAHFDGEIAGYVSFSVSGTPVPFCEDLLAATRRWSDLLISAVIRHEAASRLRDVEERLVRKQRLESLGTMAGGIAHDFNNLLVVMHGFAYFVSRAIPDDDVELAEMARSFNYAVERASQLTAQLLLFARDRRPVLSGVDLQDALPRVISMARRLVPESSVISLYVDSELTTATVEAVMLDQALLNLIQNAADAMPDGGHIAISARSRPLVDGAGGHIEILVRDSGTGMSPADLARAREPFFTTKSAGAGTGLGLAMAQTFVDRVGGGLAIESSIGLGTTVTLTLRAGPAVLDSLDLAIDLSGGIETLLVVEDDAVVRRVAQTVLQRAGYTVLTAEDGEQGLAVLERHEGIRLVVSDVVMPRMGGYAMARGIRATHPSMPVLFCSGYSALDRPAEFADDKICHSLSKPYSAEALLGYVRALLNQAPAKAHLPAPEAG